jgi:hypothetical protein
VKIEIERYLFKKKFKEKSLNRTMLSNFAPIYSKEKSRINKKKFKLKKNALDPVNFEEEKKNDPKYKTELCKSFMETNFCVYGNKCRFAHGNDELVFKKLVNHYKQKLCNTFFKKGYCPYGNRCNFKHNELKMEQIEFPYYFSHLISLHLPQLKTCKRLNIFQEISSMKKELNKNIKFENEIIIKENIIAKNNKEEKIEYIVGKLNNNSFFSENSSETTSLTDSPCKENKIYEFENNKITDFFLKDLNLELEFFSNQN